MDCSSSEVIISLQRLPLRKTGRNRRYVGELELWQREKSPGQEAQGPSKMGAQEITWESEMVVPKEKHTSAEELVKLQSALEAEALSCLRTRADGPESASPESEKPIKPVFAKPKDFNDAN
ncbi:uncharacterized protein M8220_000187 [Acridotheres tristis]